MKIDAEIDSLREQARVLIVTILDGVREPSVAIEAIEELQEILHQLRGAWERRAITPRTSR